jgi:hypothetical protein
MRVSPEEITEYISTRYPYEHWFTLFAPRTDCLLHYFTVSQASAIEQIIRGAIRHPLVEDVEATIIYSTIKSSGRTRGYLRECQGNFLEDELKLPTSPHPKIELLEQEVRI